LLTFGFSRVCLCSLDDVGLIVSISRVDWLKNTGLWNNIRCIE